MAVDRRTENKRLTQCQRNEDGCDIMVKQIVDGLKTIQETLEGPVCSVLIDPTLGPPALSLTARSIFFGGTGFFGNPSEAAVRRARDFWTTRCGYLPSTGDENIPSAGFQGGQCDTLYDAQGDYRVRYVQRNTGVEVTTNPFNIGAPTVAVNGPISGLSAEILPNQIRIRIEGSPSVVINDVFVQAESAEVVDLNMSVARQDGLPDDCGNPPPPGLGPPPGGWPDQNVLVPVDPGGGQPPVDETWTVGFDDNGPTLAPNGNPVWDLDLIGPGGVEIPVSFDLSPNGEIQIGLQPEFNLGGECCQEPRPVPADEVPPDAPPESGVVIAGVVVIVPDVPESTRYNSFGTVDGQPLLYVPRLGTVRFVYLGVSDQPVYSDDIDVKSDRTTVMAPDGRTPNGAIFTPAVPMAFQLFYLI